MPLRDHSSRSPAFIRDISYYGTGCRCYGFEVEPPDFVNVTQWIALFFVPVIPIRRARCKYVGNDEYLPHADTVFQYQVIDRLGLSAPSILLTYFRSLCGIMAAVGPPVFMFLYVGNRAATPVEIAFILGS